MLEQIRVHRKNKLRGEYVLGADVGGTRTNIVIAVAARSGLHLLWSYHFKTKSMGSLSQVLNDVLDHARHRKVKVRKACIAAAGPVKNDRVRLTNAHLSVDVKNLENNTGLKVSLINDFEAVAYGINGLPTADLVTVVKGRAVPCAPKAVVGAGTGLGKAILHYDKSQKMYVPLSSEGGHGDFPIASEMEHRLSRFIRSSGASYEELLAGYGIVNIYKFLRQDKRHKQSKYTREIDRAVNKAALISLYRSKDATCRETFKLYSTFYARCARNFALETLCYGGLYIAGGIPAKNAAVFDSLFRRIFVQHPKKKDVLRRIPVYLIKNYDVSLYGSAFVAARL